jgi:hypothetical protein
MPLACVRIAISLWHPALAGQMASSGLQGVLWRLGNNPFPSALHAGTFSGRRNLRQSMKESLDVTMPPLPFSGRGNSLAAAQLRPASGE